MQEHYFQGRERANRLERFQLLVLLLLGAVLVVYLWSWIRPALIDYQEQRLQAVFDAKAEELSARFVERESFARSLAATGEALWRRKMQSVTSRSVQFWEGEAKFALQRKFERFPGVVGGGIWYEPFRFDANQSHRGFYIQWIPPVGSARELSFTMEWSDPVNDYHQQPWYLDLIPERGRASAEIVWTAPYQDPVTKVLMVTVDAIMRDDTGNILGMSTVDWNLDQIIETISALHPSASSVASLVDAPSGLVVAHSRNPELVLSKIHAGALPPPDPSLHPPLAFSRVLGERLRFSLAIPRSDYVRQVDTIVYNTLGGVVLLIFFAASGLFLLSRRHQLQQDELVQSLERQSAQLEVARSEAERISRLKSEFLANMSHEIRTPMNGIVGFVELLREGELNPEQREYIGLITESSRHLLRIVNDILDFSKIAAGKLELHPERVEIRALVHHVIEALRVSHHNESLVYITEIYPSVPRYVQCDPDRVRQMLLNVLSNAVKYTSRGAVILQMESAQDGLEIHVTDTGCGVPQAKLSRLFEPFEQGDGSLTRRVEGTGLGLAITKQLVTLMGGRITLRSRLGVGSVCSLWIPLIEAEVWGDASEGAAARPAGAREARPEILPLRVLVAEDHPVNQRLISVLLKKRGHAVTVTGNGKEAIAALKAAEFDIVLMDIQMPEMDGESAVIHIRNSGERYSQIPIVALTAHSLVGDRERFLAGGATEFLSKPIEPGELDRVLSACQARRNPGE